MHFTRCVAALAILVVQVNLLALANTLVFQNDHIQAPLNYPTPIRFSELDFNGYTAATTYTAQVCGMPVDLDFLSKDLAVVRLKDRAKTQDVLKCSLTIFNTFGLAHVAGDMTFAHHDFAALPSVYEVSPSFYFGRTSENTKLSLVGNNLNLVKKIALADATGPQCTGLTAAADGKSLTCTLPTLTEAQAATPTQKFLLYDAGNLQVFGVNVETIPTEPVAIASVEPVAFAAGADTEATFTFATAVASRLRLPWAPVLTKRDGTPVSAATTSARVWAADGKSLKFILSCVACAGDYNIGLGEHNAFATVLIPSAAVITFTESRKCPFNIGANFPLEIPSAATADESARIFVPLFNVVNVAVAELRFSVGGVPTTAVATGLTPGDIVVEVTPGGKFPAGPTTWTIAYGNEGKTCDAPNAFTVVATDAAAPYVSAASPHVVFRGEAAGDTTRVSFSGKNLQGVASVSVRWTGAVAEAACANVAAQNALVTCDVLTGFAGAAGAGVVAVMFKDAAGAVVAKSSLWGGEWGAAVTPTTAQVGVKTAFVMTFTKGIQLIAPWALVLVDNTGKKLDFAATWNPTNVRFNDVVFARGTTAVTVELQMHGKTERIAARIAVTDEPGPEPQPTLTAAVPAVIYSGAESLPTSFRFVIENFASIRDTVKTVTLGGREAKVLATVPMLVVELTVDAALLKNNDALGLVLIGPDGEVRLDARNAVKVDKHVPKVVPVPAADTVFVLEASFPQVELYFRNLPKNHGTFTSSTGDIMSTERSTGDDGLTKITLGLAERCIGCDGKVITITADFTAEPGSEPGDKYAFAIQYALRPSTLTLTPTTFDWTAKGVKKDTCIDYEGLVDLLSPTVPLQIFVLNAAGVTADGFGLSTGTRRIFGCLTCKDCVKGEYGVAVGPVGSKAADALAFPGAKVLVVPKEGGGDDDDDDPSGGGDGGLSGGIIALIVILCVAAVAAGGYFGYRYWQLRLLAQDRMGSSAPLYINH